MNFGIEKIDSHDVDKLKSLYMLLEASGRLDVFFLYGDSSENAFISFAKDQWVYACIKNDNIVGLAFFNSFQGKTAFFHFCMFKGGEDYVLEYGRMIFNIVFRCGALLTILGLTPKVYKHVFETLNSIGMREILELKEHVEVKGKMRTAVLSCITKDEFYNKYTEYKNEVEQ